jgi:hypothetical protein
MYRALLAYSQEAPDKQLSILRAYNVSWLCHVCSAMMHGQQNSKFASGTLWSAATSVTVIGGGRLTITGALRRFKRE